MQNLYFIDDTLSDDIDAVEVTDVLQQIRDYFCTESIPGTVRIYANEIKPENNITPFDVKSLDKLSNIHSDIYVVIPPQGALTIIIAIVSIIATVLLMPKIPNASIRNIPEASANNGLSSRENQVRIGARSPYILGTVTSVPDLLTVPYSVFEKGKEVEYNYMFVSEGTVQGNYFRDGSTQIKHIIGSSAELYPPATSPNSGVPSVIVGDAIAEPFISARKSSSVNGQTLRPPNKITTTDDIKIQLPNRILFENADDLLDKYEVGETMKMERSVIGGTHYAEVGTVGGSYLTVKNTLIADLPAIVAVNNQVHVFNADYIDERLPVITSIVQSGVHVRVNLSINMLAYTPPTITTGTGEDEVTNPGILKLYIGSSLTNLGAAAVIETVSESEITLVTPNWPASFNTAYTERSFSVEGPRWTDRFILDDDNLEGVIVNLTCTNGAYKDDGSEQFRSIVECALGITSVDDNDNAIGSETLHTVTLTGSASVRDSVNETGRFAKMGRVSLRMHRSSYKDNDFDGQVVDDVKWKQLYSYRNITDLDFGDCTCVRTKTIATEGALSLKQRKLTLQATRMLPRVENNALTNTLYATKSAADALFATALDSYIGHRSLAEINVTQIIDVIESIKTYFGNDTAADFSYTLDSSDLSFEDTWALIANAIYCRAYRRGLQFNLNFEKAINTSTLLFCHRNKIPGTEKRKITFGTRKNADGVESKYLDDNGIERTVSVPTANLLNPLSVDLLGLNEFQATKHAWREWNKAQHQHEFTQFDATAEAAISILDQRILVADNVTSETFDGEVLSQEGLTLELSQDVPATGWIHLQLPTADLQAIEYIRTAANKIQLQNPTTVLLSTSPQNYARATYLISESSDEEEAFILLEKSGTTQFNLKLVNYDSRYYQNDLI